MATSGNNLVPFRPDEIILSTVEKEDILPLSEAFYQAWPSHWLDEREPPHLNTDVPTKVRRFAARMAPCLDEPGVRLIKATLSPSSPSFDAEHPHRIIGHAGWQTPERNAQRILSFWRRDTASQLGWRARTGWTDEEEDELWAGVDVEKWDAGFLRFDRIREERMEGRRHWFLAPLWVVPEYRGRGLAGLLLRDVTDIADAEDPPTVVYLEAMKEARPLYARHGFEDVEGEGEGVVMVRWGPKVKDAATTEK